MNRICIAGLVVLTLISAKAQLGETAASMSQAFGPPVEIANPPKKDPCSIERRYQFGDMVIEAGFLGGVCQRVAVAREGDAPFVESEIETLRSRFADAGSWSQVHGDLYALDSGGAYSLSGKHAVVVLTDALFVKMQQAARQRPAAAAPSKPQIFRQESIGPPHNRLGFRVENYRTERRPGNWFYIIGEVRNIGADPARVVFAGIGRNAAGQVVESDTFSADGDKIYPGETSGFSYPFSRRDDIETFEFKISNRLTWP